MTTSGSSPQDARFRRRSLLAAGLGLGASGLLAGCSAGNVGTPTPGPAATPSVGSTASRAPAGSTYRSAEGVIYAPDGSVFVPVGANLGTTNSFDWKGTAKGHAADAVAWGWNTVRLNLMVTDSASWSYVAQHSQRALLEQVSGLVDEYTGAGIVVILDAHDNPAAKGKDRAKVESGLLSWWQLAAEAFTSNPRVWSGLINEPAYTNDAWFGLMNRLATAVRDTGNPNPVLVCAPCWGQDVGYSRPYFADARFAYEPTMAPALMSRHGNVVLEQHNYGAYTRYTTPEKLGDYIGKVRAAGLTPLIAEFGYTIDESSTAGGYGANHDAAQAVFVTAPEMSVGALWWHATHGDNYALKANGGPFWDGGNDAGLSEGGRQMWALGHARG